MKKFTQEQVDAIKSSNETIAALAVRYECNPVTITRVQQGKTYAKQGQEDPVDRISTLVSTLVEQSHGRASEGVSDTRLDAVVDALSMLADTMLKEFDTVKARIDSIEADIQALRKYLRPVVDRVTGS